MQDSASRWWQWRRSRCSGRVAQASPVSVTFLVPGPRAGPGGDGASSGAQGDATSDAQRAARRRPTPSATPPTGQPSTRRSTPRTRPPPTRRKPPPPMATRARHRPARALSACSAAAARPRASSRAMVTTSACSSCAARETGSSTSSAAPASTARAAEATRVRAPRWTRSARRQRPGGTVCNASGAVVQCGADLVTDQTTIGSSCSGQTCVDGGCSGSCTPGSSRCQGQQPQSCDATGNWQNQGATCAFVCAGGVTADADASDAGLEAAACTGSCTPGAHQQRSGQPPADVRRHRHVAELGCALRPTPAAPGRVHDRLHDGRQDPVLQQRHPDQQRQRPVGRADELRLRLRYRRLRRRAVLLRRRVLPGGDAVLGRRSADLRRDRELGNRHGVLRRLLGVREWSVRGVHAGHDPVREQRCRDVQLERDLERTGDLHRPGVRVGGVHRLVHAGHDPVREQRRRDVRLESGTWSAPATCTNQACVSGACNGVCTPGTAQCSGLQPQTCSSTGTWQNTGATCPYVCSAGSCGAAVCGPGALQCNGQQPQTCDATGTWQNTGTPCPNVCSAGMWTGACTSGATECNNNGVQTCNASGQWSGFPADARTSAARPAAQEGRAPAARACARRAPPSARTAPTSRRALAAGALGKRERLLGRTTPSCLNGACVVSCTPRFGPVLGQRRRDLRGRTGNGGAWRAPIRPACPVRALEVCSPGAVQCSGNGLETCSASGQWSTPSACVNEAWVSAACTGSCTPGATQCSGQQPPGRATTPAHGRAAAASAPTSAARGRAAASACPTARGAAGSSRRRATTPAHGRTHRLRLPVRLQRGRMRRLVHEREHAVRVGQQRRDLLRRRVGGANDVHLRLPERQLLGRVHPGLAPVRRQQRRPDLQFERPVGQPVSVHRRRARLSPGPGDVCGLQPRQLAVLRRRPRADVHVGRSVG